jgi:hypothetical protein
MANPAAYQAGGVYHSGSVLRSSEPKVLGQVKGKGKAPGTLAHEALSAKRGKNLASIKKKMAGMTQPKSVGTGKFPGKKKPIAAAVAKRGLGKIKPSSKKK